MTSYGVIFSKVTTFNSSTTNMILISNIAVLLSIAESLWDFVDKFDLYISQWNI